MENVQGIEFDPKSWPTVPGPQTLAIIKDLMEQAHSRGLDDGYADAVEEQKEARVNSFKADGTSIVEMSSTAAEVYGKQMIELFDDQEFVDMSKEVFESGYLQAWIDLTDGLEEPDE